MSLVICGMQAALRDKLLQDHSVLAAFLTGLRMYLEDPTKVIHLFLLHTVCATAPCMHNVWSLSHAVFVASRQCMHAA